MKTSSSPHSRATAVSPLLLVFLALGWAGAALAGNLNGRFATIPLNGSGWQASDTMYAADEIAAGAPLATTFTNVLVANDATMLYIGLRVPAPSAITDPWTYNLYIDSDMNSGTGFNGGWMTGGYDRLVQYGASGTTYSVYSFAGGAQSGWSWNWNTVFNYSYNGSLIEWAIPLSTLGLTGDKMRMEFNVTGTGTTAETWAYKWESGVGTYTLAPVPEPASALILALAGGVLALRRRL